LPDPHAGLVIRYAYLRKREFDAGRDEGTKGWPCALVMAIEDADDEKEVLVLPIIHEGQLSAGHPIPLSNRSRSLRLV
jgi:hypothetical protein